MENPAMESKHGDAIVCATTACLRARLGTTPIRSGSGCAVTYGVLFSMPCPYRDRNCGLDSGAGRRVCALRAWIPPPCGRGADALLLMASCLACLALTGTATAYSIAVRGVAFARFAPGPRTGRTSRPDAPGRNGRGMCA